MSVIDKWLNLHRQNGEAATSATPATNPNIPCVPNALDVAGGLLQPATFLADAENVATCSKSVATEHALSDQGLKGYVADVADVAGEENSREFVADVADHPRVECCECGTLIDERLPTSWGGRPCHGACGEAAWRRAVAEGRYL